MNRTIAWMWTGLFAGLTCPAASAQQGPYDAVTMTSALREPSMALELAGRVALPESGFATLFGCDTVSDNLLEIDPSAGGSMNIGALGDSIVASLAFDRTHGRMYATSTFSNSLLEVDLVTGSTTVIGNLGIILMHGLGYDCHNDVLYGITNQGSTQSLYQIDATTGAATLVGVHNKLGLAGLAFDPDSGVMYASEAFEQALYAIDLSTAAVTLIGPFSAGVQLGVGLGFDPTLGLYASDNMKTSATDDELFRIDPTTGAATYVGKLDRGNVLGLAFDGGPCAAATRYCTAKSSLVCGTPTISSAGIPQAGATGGFQVSAGPARGNRLGLVFYSCNGRAAIPFDGGLLCVAPAIRRTPSTSSGGTTEACDGVFALDWNAFASGVGGGNPDPCVQTPGQRVNLQWWGRDSVATGSFLSDALEFDMQ